MINSLIIFARDSEGIFSSFIYLKKRVFTCGSDSKNKPEENYNYNDKVLSCRARIDYSNSSSSLNKITTACEDYKNNEYY